MSKSLNSAYRGVLPIGVSYNKANRNYLAQMKAGGRVDGKQVGGYLGSFKTPELAFAAYKVAKEAYIQSIAEQYKDDMEPRVYDAMMAWDIKITD